ncbi:unnamed protein product [Caretta caretta]
MKSSIFTRRNRWNMGYKSASFISHCEGAPCLSQGDRVSLICLLRLSVLTPGQLSATSMTVEDIKYVKRRETEDIQHNTDKYPREGSIGKVSNGLDSVTQFQVVALGLFYAA